MVASDRLKSFVERVERLESERRDLSEGIRDVYAEAKGEGFDVKVLRRVVSLRRKPKIERETEESILDLYLTALEGSVGDAGGDGV
jgi:uncharacterized protein (UPF0335 family)